MKKKSIFLAVCMVLMCVSMAQALPTYTVYDTAGRQGNGGPFEIVGNGMDFQSFCIEYGEHISISGRYYGSIDPLVYYSSGPETETAIIDSNTAGLYNYFLDHQLTLSSDQKRDIQIAIWAFQDQIDHGSPTPLSTNVYYNNPGTYSANNRTIMALNLWNGNACIYDNRAQSMLIATPEPASMLLLGLGLVGLAGARRKFKK